MLSLVSYNARFGTTVVSFKLSAVEKYTDIKEKEMSTRSNMSDLNIL